MKMNVLKYLLLPWFLLFLGIIGSILFFGIHFHVDVTSFKYFQPVIISLSVLSCYFNFLTVTKAGIWLSHSIPKHFSPRSQTWMKQALLGFFILYILNFVSNQPWTPLYWNGFIEPILTTLTVIFILWTVLSPVLIWCSTISFARLKVLTLTLPIFFFTPFAGFYMGQKIFNAYLASRAVPIKVLSPKLTSFNLIKLPSQENKNLNFEKNDESINQDLVKPLNGNIKINDSTEEGTLFTSMADNIAEEFNEPTEKRALRFKDLVLKGQPCPTEYKDILNGLNLVSSDETVYWAMRATVCANMKTATSLGRLIDIMLKHKNSNLRATAVLMMTNYPPQEVKKLNYLLLKRLSDRETLEMIEAATTLLSRLGNNERQFTQKRLTDFLKIPRLYQLSARLLVQVLDREDLIADYINENLKTESPLRKRAVDMICLLSEKTKPMLDPQINHLIKNINDDELSDGAQKALNCLGEKGIIALRDEVTQQKQLDKITALKVLTKMNIKNSNEALETVSQCLKDSSQEVRELCSHGLGKVGVAALPQIVELMQSSSNDRKKLGELALQNFKDPLGKDQLLKLRSEYSGWKVTQQKIRIGKAIDTALLKME